ncbi:MAG: ArsR/SmtB family transcription factor [Acidimicrobiales bacterium]
MECSAGVLAEPLTQGEAENLAGVLGVLAEPVRLRLLSLVASAPSGEVCVCQLVEPLGRSQPTVSHHLKILAAAGLITGERRGRWVWYRAVPESVAGLRRILD